MLGLPKSTEMSKQLPKKAVYAKFQMNTAAKEKIDADISRITIVNEITPTKINIPAGEEVGSFFVLLVALKKKDFDEKTVATLSKLIPQNILFVLEFEGQSKLAIYHTKLMQTDWKPTEAPANGWRWSEESIKEKLSTGEIKFKDDFSGIIRKIYLCDQPGRTPENLWEGSRFGTTRQAAAMIKELFDGIQVFDTPKPIELIRSMMIIALKDNNAIVLDFFSGSATTAHAVMQLNAEDGGHRKFIMVQLPEATDEKSEARKAGYKTICEIGKERIRRAGKKIKEDSPLTTQDLDIGFRVLKCDTSNMKEVYYNPAEYEASLFSRLEDNIKEDRTPEDLLFQVMLDLGVLLSGKIEETTIAGKKVFNVEDNYLIACFDSDVTEETIKAIAKQKPYYFVMRDSSMANDSVATNFDQIFATYSPDTVRKVL